MWCIEVLTHLKMIQNEDDNGYRVMFTVTICKITFSVKIGGMNQRLGKLSLALVDD